ncbi:MAG: hypothetical protein RRE78_07835 [Acidianus sp.]|nr:hypothetical protein [Acidianus sp.]
MSDILYVKRSALLLLLLLLLLYPPLHAVLIGPTDYGYEFFQYQLFGITARITFYCLNYTGKIPSIQQNFCIVLNACQIFVQNVMWYIGKCFNPVWETSLYYNWSYHRFIMTPDLTGNTYNLTTLIYNGTGYVKIVFLISNCTNTFKHCVTLKGVYRGIVGSLEGTVIAGYGCGETVTLEKGTKLEISSLYLYKGKWYVPAIILGNGQNTAEAAYCGKVCLLPCNTVLVTYNDSHGEYCIDYLALPSVIIFNNTVKVFPYNSLWEIEYPNGSTRYFVNCTTFVEGSRVCPVDVVGNYTFLLNKTYLVKSCIPIYGEKEFYIPKAEYLFYVENGSYHKIFVNGSETILFHNSSSYNTTSNNSVSSTTTNLQTSTTTGNNLTSSKDSIISTRLYKNPHSPTREFLIISFIALIVIVALLLLVLRGNKGLKH